MQVIDFFGKFILFSNALFDLLIAMISRLKTNFLSMIVIFFFNLGQCFFAILPKAIPIKRITLMLLILLNSMPIYAQEEQVWMNIDELPYSDTIDAFKNELKAINQRLRAIRLRFNHKIPLNEEELRQIVSESDLRLVLGQSKELSLELSQVLKREALDKEPSFFSLVANTGQAMVSQQLLELGFKHLRKALDPQNKTTASRYGHLLSKYLSLSQYLPLTSSSQKEAIGYWQHLNQLAIASKSTIPAKHMYQYAKFLYFQGEWDQSKSFFVSLAQGEYQFESSYFLAIIALRQNPQAPETLQLFQKLDAILSIDAFYIDQYLQSEQETTHFLPLKENFDPKEDGFIIGGLARLALLDPAVQKQREEEVKKKIKEGMTLTDLDKALQIKAVLSQSLARLSLLSEKNEQAWQYYRQIPQGFDHYQQALLEAIYVLRKRKQYTESIPFIDQLLAQSTTDLSKLQLYLWKAEALIKSEARALALDIYQKLELQLNEELASIKDHQTKLYHQSSLAWINPALANQAKSLAVDVKLEEIQYQRERQKLKEIEAFAKDKRYPAIELSLQMLKELKISLKLLDNRKQKLVRLWKEPIEALDALDQAIQQLDQRITFVISELLALKQKYDQGLIEVINRFKDEFDVLERKINQAKAKIIDLSKAFTQIALDTVSAYQAKLILSPTEVYFLEKEQATERIEQLLAMRRFELSPILAEQSELQILGTGFDILEELLPLVEKYREGQADYEIDLKAIEKQFSSPAMDLESFQQTSIADLLKLSHPPLDANKPKNPNTTPQPKDDTPSDSNKGNMSPNPSKSQPKEQDIIEEQELEL